MTHNDPSQFAANSLVDPETRLLAIWRLARSHLDAPDEDRSRACAAISRHLRAVEAAQLLRARRLTLWLAAWLSRRISEDEARVSRDPVHGVTIENDSGLTYALRPQFDPADGAAAPVWNLEWVPRQGAGLTLWTGSEDPIESLLRSKILGDAPLGELSAHERLFLAGELLRGVPAQP